jgi:hypothetical protein
MHVKHAKLAPLIRKLQAELSISYPVPDSFNVLSACRGSVNACMYGCNCETLNTAGKCSSYKLMRSINDSVNVKKISCMIKN